MEGKEKEGSRIGWIESLGCDRVLRKVLINFLRSFGEG